MKARDCNVGDIIAISDGTQWEIVEIPHPEWPDEVALMPAPGNGAGRSSHRTGYWRHNADKDIVLIFSKPTTFTPINSAKYLYKTFTGKDYKSLHDTEVTNWINKQIEDGYEFITLDSAPNWAGVTMVKYE